MIIKSRYSTIFVSETGRGLSFRFYGNESEHQQLNKRSLGYRGRQDDKKRDRNGQSERLNRVKARSVKRSRFDQPWD